MAFRGGNGAEEMDELDLYGNREIVCPHCGRINGDSFEWNVDSQWEWIETECGYCEKKFEAQREVEVSYSSRKIEGGE